MKVFVISHNAFSKTHNNGKTLSAIFSAFRKEELCQLYFTPIGTPDLDRCENYYLISDKDAIKSIVTRKKCGTSVIEGKKFPATNENIIKVNNVTRFARTLVWYFSSWYNGGLKRWIKTQNPDVLFYVGGDAIFSHRIAVRLSKRLNLPLVTYFTDDYIINPSSNLYLKLLKLYYTATVKQSKALFAIGEKMADVYTSLYHKQFCPIMNIVNIPTQEPEYQPNDTLIRVCYFGNIGIGRLQEIIRFASFVNNYIKNHLTRDISINVYTFSYLTEEDVFILKKNGITVCKGVSGLDLQDAMNSTDLFLHVESIKKNYRQFTNLSVSTKIPEYMSMAKPIIAFGPSEVASFNVIANANASLVIDDNEDLYYGQMQEECDSIIKILNNDSILKNIAHCNYIYAKKMFDIEIVSTQFRKKLQTIVL